MAFQGDSIFWVEVEKIVPNPFQPRREFNQEKLQELADSIRMYGVLQPLTVTRKEVHRDDGTFFTEYELIAGERRLRASKLANVEQVPVIIRSGEQTEQEKLELAIIENLQREDLNAVDRALAFKQLADAFNLSITQVAKKVGRSREYVSNSIRLLALPDHILDSVKTGDITEGHGRTLLMLKDKPEELEVVYREILLKKLSVREVERIARKIATDKVRKKTWANTDAHLIEMEREFTDTLGTRVQISKTDFGGKLTIDYFTESELEKLLHVIKSQRTLLENADNQQDVAPKIQELADAESALATLTKSTPLETDSAPAHTPEAAAPANSTVETSHTAHSPQAAENVTSSKITPADTDYRVQSEEVSPAPTYANQDGETIFSVPEVPTPTPAPESEAVEAVPHLEVTVTPEAETPAPASVVDETEPVAEPTPTPTPAPTPIAPEAMVQPAEQQPVTASTPETDVAPGVPAYATAAVPRPSYTEEAESNQLQQSVPKPEPVTPEQRRPRVVAMYNDKKSYITDTITGGASAYAKDVTEVPTPAPATQEYGNEQKSATADDDDLYSINRFSI